MVLVEEEMAVEEVKEGAVRVARVVATKCDSRG
jgi:hypothetical protein